MEQFLFIPAATDLWVRLGILVAAFIYAGMLPYSIKKSIQHIDIDLENSTLSFLSNPKLYDAKYQSGYKKMLFVAAISNYAFFWLLTLHYNLGTHEKLMRYLDYSFAFLTLLAFVPHNLKPLTLQTLKPFLQRMLHNLLAVIVFLLLPTLIILFQIAVLPDEPFLGISGLIIAGLFITITLLSILFNGINGLTEMLFINGISIWCIWVATIAILF